MLLFVRAKNRSSSEHPSNCRKTTNCLDFPHVRKSSLSTTELLFTHRSNFVCGAIVIEQQFSFFSLCEIDVPEMQHARYYGKQRLKADVQANCIEGAGCKKIEKKQQKNQQNNNNKNTEILVADINCPMQ